NPTAAKPSASPSWRNDSVRRWARSSAASCSTRRSEQSDPRTSRLVPAAALLCGLLPARGAGSLSCSSPLRPRRRAPGGLLPLTTARIALGFEVLELVAINKELLESRAEGGKPPLLDPAGDSPARHAQLSGGRSDVNPGALLSREMDLAPFSLLL